MIFNLETLYFILNCLKDFPLQNFVVDNYLILTSVVVVGLVLDIILFNILSVMNLFLVALFSCIMVTKLELALLIEFSGAGKVWVVFTLM